MENHFWDAPDPLLILFPKIIIPFKSFSSLVVRMSIVGLWQVMNISKLLFTSNGKFMLQRWNIYTFRKQKQLVNLLII